MTARTVHAAILDLLVDRVAHHIVIGTPGPGPRGLTPGTAPADDPPEGPTVPTVPTPADLIRAAYDLLDLDCPEPDRQAAVATLLTAALTRPDVDRAYRAGTVTLRDRLNAEGVTVTPWATDADIPNPPLPAPGRDEWRAGWDEAHDAATDDAGPEPATDDGARPTTDTDAEDRAWWRGHDARHDGLPCDPTTPADGAMFWWPATLRKAWRAGWVAADRDLTPTDGACCGTGCTPPDQADDGQDATSCTGTGLPRTIRTHYTLHAGGTVTQHTPLNAGDDVELHPAGLPEPQATTAPRLDEDALTGLLHGVDDDTDPTDQASDPGPTSGTVWERFTAAHRLAADEVRRSILSPDPADPDRAHDGTDRALHDVRAAGMAAYTAGLPDDPGADPAVREHAAWLDLIDATARGLALREGSDPEAVRDLDPGDRLRAAAARLVESNAEACAAATTATPAALHGAWRDGWEHARDQADADPLTGDERATLWGAGRNRRALGGWGACPDPDLLTLEVPETIFDTPSRRAAARAAYTAGWREAHDAEAGRTPRTADGTLHAAYRDAFDDSEAAHARGHAAAAGVPVAHMVWDTRQDPMGALGRPVGLRGPSYGFTRQDAARYATEFAGSTVVALVPVGGAS